ncbi:MAG: hypothetical protein ABII79_12120 [bacterium]
MVLQSKTKKKPANFVNNPKITIEALKKEYVVVLDAKGNLSAAHPILEFRIISGPSNYYFDVQVARSNSAALSDGPGLVGAWKETDPIQTRLSKQSFSSWSNGDKAIKLDASGKATYKMPLEWWRDLARLQRAEFQTCTLYYRVLAFPSADAESISCSTEDDDYSKAPTVKLKNNLMEFSVTDKGYVKQGRAKKVVMKFTVREANSTGMYTIVQWNKGSIRLWPRQQKYEYVTDYGRRHMANIPDWAIDRIETDPRYHDGKYQVSGGGKNAKTEDEAGGPIQYGDTHCFLSLDFRTHIHLNFDVPNSVKIKTKVGETEPYDVLIGVLDPEAVILDCKEWQARILQARQNRRKVNVTHPDEFAGPPAAEE